MRLEGAIDGPAVRRFDDPLVAQVSADLVKRAGRAPLGLGTYTDEELLGLDPAPTAVPAPWLETLTADAHEVAVGAGLRSLTIRGLYAAEPINAGQRTVRPHADPSLWAVLSMRRSAGAVVLAEMRTTAGREWMALYGQREGIWLTEFISVQGFHEFVLADTRATVDAALTWSGAHPQVLTPRLSVEMSDEEVAASHPHLAPVGQSTRAVGITRRELQHPRPLEWGGVYTGPDGMYLAVRSGPDRVRFAGASYASVVDSWRHHLREAA